jgi:hypothetical protein
MHIKDPCHTAGRGKPVIGKGSTYAWTVFTQRGGTRDNLVSKRGARLRLTVNAEESPP